MSARKHVAVIGCLVTEPLGVQSAYRSPLTAWAFTDMVLKDEPVEMPSISMTMEDNKVSGHSQGPIEIVTGNLETLERTIRADAARPRPATTHTKPRPKMEPQRSHFYLCFGSAVFCEAFCRLMNTNLGAIDPVLCDALRTSLSSARMHEALWIELGEPKKVHRQDGQKMMQTRISKMVL